MEIALTPEIERMIRVRIESGEFSQPEEVVAEALRILHLVAPPHEDSSDESMSLEELRAFIIEGIESGRREGVYPASEVMAELRRERARNFGKSG